LAPCPTITGAIATLKGARPGRRVMLRADIDALPVREERQLTYRSVNEDVMHACGHDVHTAGLLGVADVLAQRRDDLAGEFTVVFQPAEEGLGGARAMIEGGLLDRHPVDALIGAHVTSLAPVGLVATRPGILMSEALAIAVDVRGKGGHGAMASVEGNVILAISALAPRLGEIVAGIEYEGTSCACSAGVLHAGTANNVVPRLGELRGTLRTFTSEQQREAMARLDALLDDIQRTFTVNCSLELIEGTPAVVNDSAITTSVVASAATVVGAPNVLTIAPTSPSDDISEFLNRIPGCYMFIGGGLADGSSGMHHSPDFAVDDGACRVVAGVLAASAVDLAHV
jgi:amidohydrolase